METEVIASVLGALGGLASGTVAAWATLRAKRLDKVVEELKLWVSAYDTTLLEQRLKHYQTLWEMTERTSRRHISELDAKGASDLADALTEWYYRNGGIVLSGQARDAFFRARNTLEAQISEKERWQVEIVNSFSSLRTALCEDLNSRRGPTLRFREENDL